MQADDVGGLGKHLVIGVRNQHRRAHVLDLFPRSLLEERPDPQDFLDQRFDCLDEIILRGLIEFQIGVVVGDLLCHVDGGNHRGGKRAEGAGYQRFDIGAAAVPVQCFVILLYRCDEAGVDVVIERCEGGRLGFGRFQHLEFAVFPHTQHAKRKGRIVLLLGTVPEQQTGLDVLDRQWEHGHNIVIVHRRFLKHDIQFIRNVQLVRVPILELGVLLVDMPQLLALLPDVIHHLFGGDQIGQVLELEVHIDDALRTLGLDQGHEHLEEIVLLVEMDFGQHLCRDGLRLFQGVHHLLVVRIKKVVDHRIKLFEEFVKAVHQQMLIDLLDYLVAQAVQPFYVPYKGNQVELFRVDLLDQQGPVGLVDDGHNNLTSSFSKYNTAIS